MSQSCEKNVRDLSRVLSGRLAGCSVAVSFDLGASNGRQWVGAIEVPGSKSIVQAIRGKTLNDLMENLLRHADYVE